MSEREILFRGKRVDNGEWIEGGFLDTLSLKKRYVGNMFECEEIVPETVGQFTGLTDKNGTRIFEGDIVIATSTIDYGDGDRKRKAIGEIAYDSLGMIGLRSVWKDTAVWSDIFIEIFVANITDYFFEVIGNIHDNPELLKGE